MKKNLDAKDLMGIGVLVLSVYLILRLQDKRYGFSLLILSLMYLVIRERGRIPSSSAVAQEVALHEGNLRVIKALNLKGNAIFVPPRGRIKEDKVFIPLTRGGRRVPNLTDEDVFNPGLFGTEMGVMLPSPGKEILRDLENSGTLNTDSIGSEEAEALVEPFLGAEGLFDSVRIFDRGGEVKVEVMGGLWYKIHRRVEESFPGYMRQYPTPPLSAVLSAIARVKMRPMRIRSATTEGERGVVLLEGVEME